MMAMARKADTYRAMRRRPLNDFKPLRGDTLKPRAAKDGPLYQFSDDITRIRKNDAKRREAKRWYSGRKSA